jgi:hypothetical protein
MAVVVAALTIIANALSIVDACERHLDSIGRFPSTIESRIIGSSETQGGRPLSRKTEDVQGVLQLIVGMIDDFCRDHLNEEYAVLCRKLAEKLARKRPSPLLSGKPNAWAAGIVRTIGMVNFLGDKSQKPYMKMTDIDKAFGVGESTASAKSSAIRKMFKMSQLDIEWMLPSRVEESPLTWMLSVNGFIMDIRDAPREAQEVAFEQGLIPYIPADRAEDE